MSKEKSVNEMKSDYIVELSKPYLFEGEEFTSVDLSGLDSLSTKDLLVAERAWMMKGNVSPQLETNMSFCIEIAVAASGKTHEFFEGLPFKDGIAVKNKVINDFFEISV